jgi:hypothetical protein
VRRPNSDPNQKPAPEPKGLEAVLRAAGARGNCSHKPLRGFDAYVSGFQCAKDMPKKQREAHHFLKRLGPDLIQCVIFDGEGPTASLVGVEYILSERAFEQLPGEERTYWHPHNYEVLSGQLVAPGLPAAAEKALLRLLVNSYGKTWQLWDAVTTPLSTERQMPLGTAQLMWSFNKDGQLDATLERQRNKRLDVSLEQKRREREEMIALAQPQEGVELLTRSFGDMQRAYPGVVDVRVSSSDTTVS